MPGVLAATSFPNRTSPVNRGVWVLERVLGDHVPPAPPDVPALEKQDQQAVANLTLRERTELHRTDPVCANCHRLLDPIGFGLENFDAIGRWRDRDDVDAVLMTGGTGVSSRDQTYETVTALLTKPLPGYGELFRMLSYEEIGAAAILSRATGGLMGRTVVLTMPGSRAAVRLAMDRLVLPELSHFVWEILRQKA